MGLGTRRFREAPVFRASRAGTCAVAQPALVCAMLLFNAADDADFVLAARRVQVQLTRRHLRQFSTRSPA